MEAFAAFLDVAGAPPRQVAPALPLQRAQALSAAARVPAVAGRTAAQSSAVGSSSAAATACVATAAFVVARRPRTRQPIRVSRRVAALAEEDADKVAFAKSLFTDVLDIKVPHQLEVFLSVLKGSDYTLLGKDDWRKIKGDMHPFLLPLAFKGDLDGDDDSLEVAGYLVRNPNGENTAEMQVVSQKARRTKVVELLAFDVPQYIAKRAEEAHFRNEIEDKPVIEATKDVYDVQFKGSDRTALDKWLLLEVGAFPDVYKNLSQERIEGGDPQSGLVIADTMRDAFGTGWGFPHAYCAKVLREHFDGLEQASENRTVEADHCAQRCFTAGYPLWTLEETEANELGTLLLEAKMQKLGDVDSLRVWYLKRVVDDQRAAVRTGSISLGCAAMAQAQALMDAVCCGHKSYQGIRPELAEKYEEVPGCEPLCEMMYYFDDTKK